MSTRTDAADERYLVRLGPPARGDTVHRNTCRFAQRPNALRWRFADDNPDYDWVANAPQLKQCQVCMPPSPASGNVERGGSDL